MIQLTRAVAAAALALVFAATGCGSSSNSSSMDLSAPDLGRYGIVFVTSMNYNGDFGGVIGADTICLDAAQVAALPGDNYMAWMSDSASSALARLTHDVGPWQRRDGVRVFTHLADLGSGNLLAPIDIDENSQKSMGNDVWTGTVENGTSIGTAQKTCLDWTQSGMNTMPPVPQGLSGSTNNKDAGWTNNILRPCTNAQAIYCIQQ
jgi:hypothetical protein